MATLPSFGSGLPPGSLPTSMSFRPNRPVIGDADPISPGVQTTPGVVTATGPTRVASGSSFGGFTGPVGIPTIVTRPGVITGSIGVVGGAVDADPITPGIQSRPGVVTTTGPPRVISGSSVIGGVTTATGSVVDADPITPGIQSRPGVVTPMGPPRIVSGVGGYGAIGGLNTGAYTTTARTITSGVPGRFVGGMIGTGVPIRTGNIPGAVVDADPITPGIQSQPGVVTPTGPPTIVSGSNTLGAGGAASTITSGIAGALFGSFGVGAADADPITPGIQGQPGVVTQTGPTTVIGNTISAGGMNSSGFNSGGGMLSSGVYSGPPLGFQTAVTAPPILSSGIRNSRIQQNYSYGGGFVDADPLTPGIQLQPGTITPTGPSVTVSYGGWGNFPTGVVDADPITPGIQASPGIVTQTGPTTIISGPALGSFVRGGVIDADPVTPGIQSTPGMVTPTGPSVVVGNSNNQSGWDCWNYCPWWLWPVLGLLLLGGLLGGLYGMFKPKIGADEDEERSVRTECSGYLNENGDCVACPQGSRWNGKTCTYKSSAKASRTTVQAEEGENPAGAELPSEMGQGPSGSGNKKVPVFTSQGNEQAIDSVLKSSSLAGFAPTIVTSKPTPAVPSKVIDAASGSSTSAQSEYTSTNIVTVPAITRKQRVAPTYTYSSSGVAGGASGSGASKSRYVSRFSSGARSGGETSRTTRSRRTKIITKRIQSYEYEPVQAIESPPMYRHLTRA